MNRYFPESRLTTDDILRTFAGARPLMESADGVEEDAVSRDDRLLNPAPGLWAITGGKLTTYRAMAKRVVDALVRERFHDRTLRAGSTIAPLPGASEPLPPMRRRVSRICGVAMDRRPAQSSSGSASRRNWLTQSIPARPLSGEKWSTRSSTNTSNGWTTWLTGGWACSCWPPSVTSGRRSPIGWQPAIDPV